MMLSEKLASADQRPFELPSRDLGRRGGMHRLRALMHQHRMLLLTGFPSDEDRLLNLMRHLGTPMPNYSSILTPDDRHDSSDAARRFINDVTVKPVDSGGGAIGYLAAGELALHSSRSWAAERPNWFAMQMIDPGWTSFSPGNNGESTIVIWREHFRHLSLRDGGTYERHVGVLLNTGVRFPADKVVEALSADPIFHRLDESRDEFDLGVRLKSGLLSKLNNVETMGGDMPDFVSALRYFVEALADSPAVLTFQLRAGDVILFDNRCVAHGRKSYFAQRVEPCGNGAPRVTVNPRRLWSIGAR